MSRIKIPARAVASRSDRRGRPSQWKGQAMDQHPAHCLGDGRPCSPGASRRRSTTSRPRSPAATASTRHEDRGEAVGERWTGGLLDCACSTSLTICASAVSPPVLVTRTISRPSRLTVPPMTASPALLGDGKRFAGEHRFVDGRAALDHDAVDGTRSPGRTRTRSPRARAATTGRLSSSSSPFRRDELAASAVRRREVEQLADRAAADCRARASSQWPRLISASRPVASMK